MAFYLGLVTRPKSNGYISDVGLSSRGMIDLISKETSLLHPNPINVKATNLWVRMLLSFIKR